MLIITVNHVYLNVLLNLRVMVIKLHSFASTVALAVSLVITQRIYVLCSVLDSTHPAWTTMETK